MSALIKFSTAAAGDEAVRPFAAPPRAAVATVQSRESLLEARIFALESEITERDEALPGEIEKARAEAASKALEERSEAEQQALEALQKTLTAARGEWAVHLQSWEAASAAIAREVLAQVFVDAGNRAELVEAAIRRRLKLVEMETIVRVRVSHTDFGDERKLAAAAAEIGAGVELVGDPKLQSGECVIDLKIGHVDLSLGAQWERICQLLDRVERESSDA